MEEKNIFIYNNEIIETIIYAPNYNHEKHQKYDTVKINGQKYTVWENPKTIFNYDTGKKDIEIILVKED